MSQEHNKKTLRQFQCRDSLWEIFEQMSAEFECSVDYLINEAMRQYARSRNYATRQSSPPGRPSSATPPPGSIPSVRQAAAPAPAARISAPPPPAAPPPVAPPPASAPRGASTSYPGFGAPPGAPPAPYGAPRPSYAPPAPYAAPPARSSYPPGPTVRPPGFAPPPAPAAAPPPLPGSNRPPAGAPVAGAMPSLFVIFNGQKIPVAKEEFVIGRGSKTADLPIKDGNISRRHAAVVLQNGAFYMKDLGSTNGIEFQGRRVDSRRIEEGDVYQICDYELRFTYR